jgi:hypothetical protein
MDFRFFAPPDIAKAMERAGFRVEMSLERASYPREAQTRRAYLLARLPTLNHVQNDLSVRRRLAQRPKWPADHIGGSSAR